MMGEGKYPYIQVTRRNGEIFSSKDEPMFLFRAQDRHTPDVIDFYASLVEPNSPVDAQDLNVFANKIREWQSQNSDKVKDPD